MVGISSGAIAAFNAAWHRPQSWGLVLSHCGSFTGLNGGQNYPFVVRRSPHKVRAKRKTAPPLFLIGFICTGPQQEGLILTTAWRVGVWARDRTSVLC